MAIEKKLPETKYIYIDDHYNRGTNEFEVGEQGN